MNMRTNFDKFIEAHQVSWRQKHVTDQRLGAQNDKFLPWILPPELWTEGLWPGIRESLPAYLQDKKIEKHKGVHNLKSSWMLCANLYFPFRQGSGQSLLAGFLKQQVSPRIETVEDVQLEYEEDDPDYKPQKLLGEPETGQRGANQTSPDVAFVVRTVGGRGLIITENKLVEHSFYPCSGRKLEVQNPDSRRCLNWQTLQSDIPGQCWQCQWEQGARKNRKYWEHIRLSEHGRRTLTRCPAATGGYQLFRQQALAEGIAASGRYDLVVSCVAHDARNDTLIHCLRYSGVDDFTTGWSPLFDGQAKFASWTHQQWVGWVRERGGSTWRDWLSYVEGRYEYGEMNG